MVKRSFAEGREVGVVGATPGTQGYALSLQVSTDRGRMVLTNLYLPPETGDGCREEVMREVREHLEEVGGADFPVVVGGDMNAAWMLTDRGPRGLERMISTNGGPSLLGCARWTFSREELQRESTPSGQGKQWGRARRRVELMTGS